MRSGCAPAMRNVNRPRESPIGFGEHTITGEPNAQAAPFQVRDSRPETCYPFNHQQGSTMKFHDYKTLWSEMQGKIPPQVTEEMFYATAMAGGARTGNGLIVAEGIWKQLRRPYYQVWPAIVPALLNLRLDLEAALIRTPMAALAVRLPADRPIDELPGVQTALMCQDGPGEDLRLWVNFMRPPGLANMHLTLGCEPGKTLEESFEESAANTQSYVISDNFMSEEYMPLVQNCLRLCAMLCLLADDPEVISPDVLAADRQKYEQSGGEQKFVDRAHRRGKVGWNVGQKIEVMPHYRRPHPALVWTGQGPRSCCAKGAWSTGRCWRGCQRGWRASETPGQKAPEVNMQLAWATDIHLNFLDLPDRQRFLETVNDQADALVVTGDIAESNSLGEILRQMSSVLDMPIYFVLGNHDFYRGSAAGTRAEVAEMIRGSGNLVYLSQAGVVELTPGTALVGHDGWADGRLGDLDGTDVILNDFLLIDELRHWRDRHTLDKPALRRMLETLGDEAAAYLKSVLIPATELYPQVIVATHVPPFREAAWHEGRTSGEDYLPFFSCQAVGDVLLEAAKSHPNC